jgi:hypothetical protein
MAPQPKLRSKRLGINGIVLESELYLLFGTLAYKHVIISSVPNECFGGLQIGSLYKRKCAVKEM